jgi:hypothetical protein
MLKRWKAMMVVVEMEEEEKVWPRRRGAAQTFFLFLQELLSMPQTTLHH